MAERLHQPPKLFANIVIPLSKNANNNDSSFKILQMAALGLLIKPIRGGRLTIKKTDKNIRPFY